MNLRTYYQRIREAEAAIKDPFPVVKGKGTSVLTEVTQSIAAKMIVEDAAVLASPEEAAAFRKQQADALRRAKEAADAARVQVAVVSADEIRKISGKNKE